MALKGFKIQLDKKGSKEALRFMDKFPDEMEKINEISLFKVGLNVRNIGAGRAPHDTGTLRKSLAIPSHKNAIFKEKKNKVEVGSNLDYAWIQNFGNFKHKKGGHRFFLSYAMEKMANGGAFKVYEREIKKSLKV